PPVFPDDADLLHDALNHTGARLVVADPIVSYLGATAGLNGPQVRKALSPLARIAQQARANFSMVRHLNKNDGGQRALYRGTGSIQVVAAARPALLVGRDPHDPQRRLLACTKTNLALPPPTLSFRIRNNEHGLPVLDWTGPVDIPADEFLLAGGVRYGATV